MCACKTYEECRHPAPFVLANPTIHALWSEWRDAEGVRDRAHATEPYARALECWDTPADPLALKPSRLRLEAADRLERRARERLEAEHRRLKAAGLLVTPQDPEPVAQADAGAES
jgi:hypothetical protein